jgi:hypothetical protein
VDRWLVYLEQRWAEGCHNRSQLWRELQVQGADFAQVTLRRWFRVRLGVRRCSPQSSLSPPRERPSPRQIRLGRSFFKTSSAIRASASL